MQVAEAVGTIPDRIGVRVIPSMLNFDPNWRFESPGPISEKVRYLFVDLIRRCVVGDNGKQVFEHFKRYFAIAAGTTAYESSSLSWAETDLDIVMSEASANAPLFIEAFFDACQNLPEKGPRPPVALMNRLLQEGGSDWRINPPDLILVSAGVADVPPGVQVPENLDDKAKNLIFQSLGRAEDLLSEGHNRLAVQEIIWLLETVSTIFQGMQTDKGTIEGKYFNKIVGDLRRIEKGTTFEQVLVWITTLHGYLSSPSGGGIRHGANISAATPEIEPNEARLYCNLIRSYITYLLAEHHRLTR